jgi:hypothetical protein
MVTVRMADCPAAYAIGIGFIGLLTESTDVSHGGRVGDGGGVGPGLGAACTADPHPATPVRTAARHAPTAVAAAPYRLLMVPPRGRAGGRT